MNQEQLIIKEFKEHAIYRMDESIRMIRLSIDRLSEIEIWRKPNDSSNSIANLILHLCGNIRQYAIASLSSSEDIRDRDEEFTKSSGYRKFELIQLLIDTVSEAKQIIRDLDAIEMTRIREVQGFKLSGLGVILHVVEHFSYHTGQIALITKYLKNKDLGFFMDKDLNKKNKR